jgi:hypothetical protein
MRSRRRLRIGGLIRECSRGASAQSIALASIQMQVVGGRRRQVRFTQFQVSARSLSEIIYAVPFERSKSGCGRTFSFSSCGAMDTRVRRQRQSATSLNDRCVSRSFTAAPFLGHLFSIQEERPVEKYRVPRTRMHQRIGRAKTAQSWRALRVARHAAASLSSSPCCDEFVHISLPERDREGAGLFD